MIYISAEPQRRTQSRSHYSRFLIVPAVLWVGLLAAGCSGPKLRLGTLPYPGLPILHKVADPADLGEHRYQSVIGLLDAEQERGIIYTLEAGFIDIAHVRHTVDWTRFVAEQVGPALEQRASSLTFDAAWSTRVHLLFDYPPDWDELPDAQRQRLIRDLTILISQRTAYALGTWHEVITWWGYKRVPFSSERRSAFTYDDTVSHLIGLDLAAQVLRTQEGDYNRRTTVALNAMMGNLGAVSPDATREAIAAVEGWWWNGGSKKRHLETGYGGEIIRPMLVPGFAPEADDTETQPTPLVFYLPTIQEIDAGELDLGEFFHLELEPRIGLWRKIRRKLPNEPQRLVPKRDLPILVEIIRHEMRQEIGATVDFLESPPPQP